MLNFFKRKSNKEYKIDTKHSRYNYLQFVCVAKAPLKNLPNFIEEIKFDYSIGKNRKQK